MLEGVLGPTGTAPEAAVAGYDIAGKTGTAEKPENGVYSKDKFVASFVGFAPAQDPQLLVAVIVDEPKVVHSGGEVAAPGVREDRQLRAARTSASRRSSADVRARSRELRCPPCGEPRISVPMTLRELLDAAGIAAPPRPARDVADRGPCLPQRERHAGGALFLRAGLRGRRARVRPRRGRSAGRPRSCASGRSARRAGGRGAERARGDGAAGGRLPRPTHRASCAWSA